MCIRDREYAAERRKAGMGLIASAVSAAKARLRPILMTALTMIFGLFPLVVATGVGANGNRSLGTGVVGGMTIGTLAVSYTHLDVYKRQVFISFQPFRFDTCLAFRTFFPTGTWSFIATDMYIF